MLMRLIRPTYYADTGARMGGKCAIDERMLREMRELLGEKNVIVK